MTYHPISFEEVLLIRDVCMQKI